MSRSVLLLPLGVVAFFLVACDPARSYSCPDDLYSRVEPDPQTVRVGESYVAVASAWGCGRTKRLTDDWRYFVVDTAIARVDSITGRVTGRAPGSTDVGARGAFYGDVDNRSRLTVTP